MDKPRILVVMPVYNARPYISAAIESILNQTYPHYQLLVINDGSTDGSEKIVESYSDRGVMLWHQKNQGPGSAMNRAMQYAHEQQIEYIARIDADDISLPDRFEKQVALMQKYPESAACSANCYYIDPVSEEIIGTSTVSSSPRLIRWEITTGLRGLIQGVTLFKTEALYSIGGYRDQFKMAEETDLFLRLTENFEMHNSTSFLAKIRLNPDSLSMSNVRKNILYHSYAMDCASNRGKQHQEREFEDFVTNMSWKTKWSIWHEEHFLQLWRKQLNTRHHLFYLLLASAFDPRRVFFRILRKISK